MKRLLAFASPVVLGLLSGVALVAANNGCSKSSAQTATPSGSTLTVVDSTGSVLGALLGAGPGFSAEYDSNGTPTLVFNFPLAEMHTFLDANKHIWNVSGAGDFFQPVASVFFTAANCAAPGYVEQGDPKVVFRHQGTYWIRSGAASTITPMSYYPAGSPSGTCETYPPPNSTKTTISAVPVSSLVAVTPPTIVPPVTIN